MIGTEITGMEIIETILMIIMIGGISLVLIMIMNYWRGK